MYRYDRIIRRNHGHYHDSSAIVLGIDSSGLPVSLAEKDFSGHLLVLGKSGTGKSNLISNIISELIQKQSTVVLIDPHGDLMENLVQNHTASTLYVSPFSSRDGRHVGFNVLGDVKTEMDAEITSQWIKEIFAISSDLSGNTWGPRISLVLGSLVKEFLYQNPGANLSDFSIFITNRNAIRKLISSSKNRELSEFLLMQQSNWSRWVEYVSSSLNKLVPVLSNSLTRGMVSSRHDSVDLQEQIAIHPRLIAIDCSKRKMPEETGRILSLLMLMKIWNILLKNGKPDNPVFIAIDEAHNVPSVILERMLSEGRKLGIRLILATQFLSQLGKSFISSIEGNVRNFVSFSVSQDDARILAKEVPDRRIQEKLMDVLIGQRSHNAVIWTYNNTGFHGPTHLRPDYRPSVHSLQEMEAVLDALISQFGELREEHEMIEESPGMHEQMVETLRRFLLRNGIELRTGEKISGFIPDGIFRYNGTDYVVEVEVSDLSRSYRVLEKIARYSGRKLLLLAPEGSSETTYRTIFGAINFTDNNGLFMENGPSKNGSSIRYSDMGEFFSGIYIVECRGQRLYLSLYSRLQPFSVRDLLGPGTPEKSMSRTDAGKIALEILKEMIRSRVYAADKRSYRKPDHMSEPVFASLIDRIEGNLITPGSLFYAAIEK